MTGAVAARASLTLPERFSVATGVGGSQFHRDHRYPGARPVILGRFFALTTA
jgi:hypothetical protein